MTREDRGLRRAAGALAVGLAGVRLGAVEDPRDEVSDRLDRIDVFHPQPATLHEAQARTVEQSCHQPRHTLHLVEQPSDLGAAQDDGQPMGPPGVDQAVQSRQLEPEDVPVQKQDRGQGLVLSGRGDPPLRGEPAQELGDSLGPDPRGVATAEVRALRAGRRRRGGRPALPVFVKSIHAMERFVRGGDDLFGGLEAVGTLDEDEALSLYSTVSDLRTRCEALQVALRERALGARTTDAAT